jgi:hypothetical protein
MNGHTGFHPGKSLIHPAIPLVHEPSFSRTTTKGTAAAFRLRLRSDPLVGGPGRARARSRQLRNAGSGPAGSGEESRRDGSVAQDPEVREDHVPRVALPAPRAAGAAGTQGPALADTFNNHFHPEVAQAAVEVLEHAGFQVEIPPVDLCCGRPLYDYGMLDLARRPAATDSRGPERRDPGGNAGHRPGAELRDRVPGQADQFLP